MFICNHLAVLIYSVLVQQGVLITTFNPAYKKYARAHRAENIQSSVVNLKLTKQGFQWILSLYPDFNNTRSLFGVGFLPVMTYLKYYCIVINFIGRQSCIIPMTNKLKWVIYYLLYRKTLLSKHDIFMVTPFYWLNYMNFTCIAHIIWLYGEVKTNIYEIELSPKQKHLLFMSTDW